MKSRWRVYQLSRDGATGLLTHRYIPDALCELNCLVISSPSPNGPRKTYVPSRLPGQCDSQVYPWYIVSGQQGRRDAAHDKPPREEKPANLG